MPSSAPIEAQRYLNGLDYPATKTEIVSCAEDEGADDHLLDTLRDQLPNDTFETPSDISLALSR